MVVGGGGGWGGVRGRGDKQSETVERFIGSLPAGSVSDMISFVDVFCELCTLRRVNFVSVNTPNRAL